MCSSLFPSIHAGIGIHAEYKYCSKRSAALAGKLQLPDLQFLGLSLSDVETLGILPQTKLALTQRDRNHIRNMLNSDVGQNDTVIAQELKQMQQLNCKAEIEALSLLGNDFLTEYTLKKRQKLLDEAEIYARETARAEVAASVSADSAVEQPAAAPVQQEQPLHTTTRVEGNMTVPDADVVGADRDDRDLLKPDDEYMFHTSDTYVDDGDEWFA